MTHRVRNAKLFGCLAIAGVLFIAGCAVPPSKPADKSAPMDQPHASQAAPKTNGAVASAKAAASPSAAGPATEPAAFNPAESLQRSTAAYAKEMEAALAARQNQPPTDPAAPANVPLPSSLNPTTNPIASAAAPRKSAVDWGDPKNPRLGYADNSQKPGVQPAILETSPSVANPPPLTIESRQANSAEPNAAATLTDQRMSVDAPKPGAPESVDDFTNKLAKRTQENPRDLAGQLDYQLMKYVRDDRVPDQAAIASMPAEDREMITAVVDGLSNFKAIVRQDGNMLLSKKVRPLLEMADRLRSQADLMIPTLALCTNVRAFGEYDPIEPCRFIAGLPHEVILYCEIENFSSQQDERQLWQTRITKNAVLYAENGLAVWNDKSESISDASRRRRHDFFLVKKLTLPPTLTAGRYLLKVTIVDDQASRVAESTLPITMVASSMPKAPDADQPSSALGSTSDLAPSR